MMGTFTIITGVVDTEVYTFVTTRPTVHLKSVHFLIFIILPFKRELRKRGCTWDYPVS